MYRQYEDPHMLEQELIEVKSELEAAYAADDENRIISLSETVHDLECRINFAWQDDEYDCE